MLPDVDKAARLSPDGRYRYWLRRRWAGRDGVGVRYRLVTFVMLNPSTADAELDDPTIRRCQSFARSWGYDGIMVVNLYALRSTDPKGLWLDGDPVGPRNDSHLRIAAFFAQYDDTPIVAAWGANARPERVAEVLAIPHMDRLTCLGVTKDGSPRHPLYVRGDTPTTAWPPPGRVT